MRCVVPAMVGIVDGPSPWGATATAKSRGWVDDGLGPRARRVCLCARHVPQAWPPLPRAFAGSQGAAPGPGVLGWRPTLTKNSERLSGRAVERQNRRAQNRPTCRVVLRWSVVSMGHRHGGRRPRLSRECGWTINVVRVRDGFGPRARHAPQAWPPLPRAFAGSQGAAPGPGVSGWRPTPTKSPLAMVCHPEERD